MIKFCVKIVFLECEKKTITKLFQDKPKLDKKKKWFTQTLARLSTRRKVLRHLEEAHGEDHRAEMNMIRSQFRKIKKEEINKLKGKEIRILKEKYDRNRLKFWQEISPIQKLNELGLDDMKTNIRIEGTLIQSYVRPRLIYGTEAFELNKDEKKRLCECEAKIIKRALQLLNNSYTTELYETMGVSSLAWAMKKRRISFFGQLMENETTSKLVMTRESSMEDVFEILKIGSGSDNRIKSMAITKCREELKRINEMEENDRKNVSSLAKIIMRLLEERHIGKND